MKTLVTLNLSVITTTFPGFLSYPSVYRSLAKYGREGGDPGKEVYYVLFINTKDFTEKKNYPFVVFIAINTTLDCG